MKINLAQFLLFSLWLMSIGSFITFIATGYTFKEVQWIAVVGGFSVTGYGILLISKFIEAWDDKQ
jgi:hypothetical protein